MYSIGMVVQVLDISPKRLYYWEQKGLVTPGRKNGRRCYSELDLQRLMFIKRLLDSKRCRPSALSDYLAWYPCWRNGICPPGNLTPKVNGETRPCWQKKKGWYCLGKNFEEEASNGRL